MSDDPLLTALRPPAANFTPLPQAQSDILEKMLIAFDKAFERSAEEQARINELNKRRRNDPICLNYTKGKRK